MNLIKRKVMMAHEIKKNNMIIKHQRLENMINQV